MGRKKKEVEPVVKAEGSSNLKKIMNEMNRKYEGCVIKFASEEQPPERTPFGIPELDELTGGGLPSKRFSIIWGNKGTAKSTLCLMAIAQAQKKGKVCAYIDMERTFDPLWATKYGVDLSTLILASGFDNAEQAMDSFLSLVKNQVVDFVVLDSVQAMSPKGEQESKKGKEKSVEDDTMALLARKLSQFFRMAVSSVYKGDVTVLLVGQARMDLGGFIALESLSGGNALQHYSSMTIYTRRGSKADAPTRKEITELPDGSKEKVELTIGFDSVIKLEKRKVESKVEGTQIHLPFYFETGYIQPEERG